MDSNGASQSLEAGVASAFQRVQDSLQERYLACEDSVRKSPGSSLVIAGIAGYVFRSLPIGALLGGVIRLVMALIRPALFLYVAAKGYELLQRSVPDSNLSTRVPTEGGSGKRAQRASRG